jgi:hypothetical protein
MSRVFVERRMFDRMPNELISCGMEIGSEDRVALEYCPEYCLGVFQ